MAGGVVSRSHGIAALVLGIIELVGAIAIAIVSFVLAGKFNASVALTPYWAGLPYVVPGILGIVVGVTKNQCAMIAFMVVNIICFVIDSIACILLIIVVALWTTLANAATAGSCIYSNSTCYCEGVSLTRISGVSSCGIVKTITALILTIVAFAVINCIVSLAASIVGCASVCCGQSNQPGTVIIQQPVQRFAQPQQGYAQGPGCGQQPPPSYDMNVKH